MRIVSMRSFFWRAVASKVVTVSLTGCSASLRAHVLRHAQHRGMALSCQYRGFPYLVCRAKESKPTVRILGSPGWTIRLFFEGFFPLSFQSLESRAITSEDIQWPRSQSRIIEDICGVWESILLLHFCCLALPTHLWGVRLTMSVPLNLSRCVWRVPTLSGGVRPRIEQTQLTLLSIAGLIWSKPVLTWPPATFQKGKGRVPPG